MASSEDVVSVIPVLENTSCVTRALMFAFANKAASIFTETAENRNRTQQRNVRINNITDQLIT